MMPPLYRSVGHSLFILVPFMLPVRLSCHRSIGQSVIHRLFLLPLCCLSDYDATALSVSRSFIVYSCTLYAACHIIMPPFYRSVGHSSCILVTYAACQIIMPPLYRSVGHSSFILVPFMLPVRLSCHRSIGQSVIHRLFLLPLCCLSDYHATALSVSWSFIVYSCALYAACQIIMPPLYRSVGHSSFILAPFILPVRLSCHRSIGQSVIHCLFLCPLCCLSDYHATALSVSWSFIVYSCALYVACQIIMPPLYRSVGHSSFILAPFMLPVRLSCHCSIGQSVIHRLFLCPLCCLLDYDATVLSVSRSFSVYSCSLYAACQIMMPPFYRSVGHSSCILVTYAACQIIMPPLYRSVGHSLFILVPFMLPVRLSCHSSIGQLFIHCLFLCPLCCLSDYHATVLSVSRSFIVYSCALYAACQIIMPPLYRSVGHSLFILVPFMLPVRLSCHRSIGQSVISRLFLLPLCCLSDYDATALSVSQSLIVYSCALYAAC